MLRSLILSTLIFSLSLFANNDKPFFDSISFSYGQNAMPDNVFRVGVQRSFQERYFESNIGYVHGYYDLAINRWEYNEDDLSGLTLTPVFTYHFKTISYKPYLFFGIGLAYISEKRVDTKEFSTHFQFEDQLGVGLQFEQFKLQLGYYHYSNASIKEPNDGMDIGMLSFLYKF